ncbi:MAG: replication-associated recombination protein A [Lachnospiraceae bacterium]|nr:replication-associated recombination protein A [Lachnospiraceae bacterium]MCI9135042.1 replication-associated recombination protein A [Lachnospiraceae bacterium]
MEQLSLFDDRTMQAPLASRLRPETLEEYVGQEHLLGKGKVLRRLIERDQISSMIFWGPPGVGKTTLARIIAGKTRADFVEFSAVTSGIREIKDVMNRAEHSRQMGLRTLLFVDEIHRFNKAQQDAFLPFVEKGSVLLVGATTENPSFEINSALLSRCKVFVLKALETGEIARLLELALESPKGLGNQEIVLEEEQRVAIARFANGDARTALNTLEMAVLNSQIQQDGRILVTDEVLAECMNRRSLLYDKNGEEHYNLISALHKSMRNSDPDAAVYWMCRMLDGGEDPLYIARRLVRFASEDVGMADSQALQVAVAAYQACHFLGMPECDVHLTHAVTYLAMAPKSNALYQACEQCKQDIRQMPAEPVPLHLCNAPTSLMKELRYGEGYIYAHDTAEKLSRMQCLPEALRDRRYYRPTDQGQEAGVRERLSRILLWKSQDGKSQV